MDATDLGMVLQLGHEPSTIGKYQRSIREVVKMKFPLVLTRVRQCVRIAARLN